MQSESHQSIHRRSFRPPELEKNLPPTLATIPLRGLPEENDQSPNAANHISCLEESEKVIPGYNFQSLFRKKSHIRLARKKNRLEAAKKNSNVKVEICEKQSKNTQKGHWTTQENKLYHWFLEIHNRHFIFKHLRRTDKIFKSMASFIKTRQAEQCRSHHQKMEKKYHTFYQILLRLRGEFYNSVSPDQLRYELQQNGYRLKDAAIITELELKNGDIAQRNPEQDPPSFNSPPHSLQEEEQVSKQENNLLGQNYEHELHLKLNY